MAWGYLVRHFRLKLAQACYQPPMSGLPKLELGGKLPKKRQRAPEKWLNSFKPGGAFDAEADSYRPVPAEAMLAGEHVNILFKEHCSNYMRNVTANLPRLTMGVLSRGAGVADVVDAMNATLKTLPLKAVEMAFVIEGNTITRAFLLKTTPSECCCLAQFALKGWCYKHEKQCALPAVGIVCTVLPEKDVVTASREGFGSGIPGPNAMRDLQSYLEFSGATTFAIVGAIGDETLESPQAKNANFEVLSAQLSARGFESQAAVVNVRNFGVPVASARLLFGSYNPSSKWLTRGLDCGKIDSVFVKFLENVRSSQRAPPSCEDLLLQATHPAVERNLSLRLVTPFEDKKKNWAEEHMKEYQNKFQRWGAMQCHTTDKDSPWFGVLSEREVDSLALNTAMHPMNLIFHADASITMKQFNMSRVQTPAERSDLKHTIHLAPAQQATARPWIRGAHALSGTRYGRLQLGRETMVLSGFPVGKHYDVVDNTSEDALLVVGGQMLSPPVVLGWLSSLLAALPWVEANPEVEVIEIGSGDDAIESSCSRACSDSAKALGLFQDMFRPSNEF
jgi:hypothetical protein